VLFLLKIYSLQIAQH